MGETPLRAIPLHGSFAATSIGHATDCALVVGVLGWCPDDERLKDALIKAEKLLDFEIGAIDLGESAHPSSVRIELSAQTRSVVIEGASVCGGSVITTKIDDCPTEVRGQLGMLVLWHHDNWNDIANASLLFPHTVSVYAPN